MAVDIFKSVDIIEDNVIWLYSDNVTYIELPGSNRVYLGLDEALQ